LNCRRISYFFFLVYFEVGNGKQKHKELGEEFEQIFQQLSLS